MAKTAKEGKMANYGQEGENGHNDQDNLNGRKAIMARMVKRINMTKWG